MKKPPRSINDCLAILWAEKKMQFRIVPFPIWVKSNLRDFLTGDTPEWCFLALGKDKQEAEEFVKEFETHRGLVFDRDTRCWTKEEIITQTA